MNRFLLRFVVFASLCLAGVLLLIGALLAWRLNQQIDTRHHRQSESIGWILGDPTSVTANVIAPKIDAALAGFPETVFIQIDDGAGNIRYRSKNLSGHSLVFPTNSLHQDVVVSDHLKLRVSVFYHGTWRVLIASPLNGYHDTLGDFAWIAASVWFCGTLASYAGARVFVRRERLRLQSLQRVISQVNADRLDQRIELSGDDPALSGLVTELNQLFARLEPALQSSQDAMGQAWQILTAEVNALREPLQRLEPMLAKNGEAQRQGARLREGVDRLHRMTEGVDFLSRFAQGTVVFDPQPLDTDAWLKELVHDANLLAADQEVRVTLLRAEAGIQSVDPALLRQLFLHLLSNALAVSPKGSEITVEAFSANDRWHLAMADQGPGLPVEQHNRVFEPFARYDHPDLAGYQPGVGLGLTLCQRIAELHGGNIRARNPEVGLRVALSLPERGTADV